MSLEIVVLGYLDANGRGWDQRNHAALAGDDITPLISLPAVVEALELVASGSTAFVVAMRADDLLTQLRALKESA